MFNYVLALFDLKLNTIVSFDLAFTKDSKTIYEFLDKSTYNKEKFTIIITDLKHEYHELIYKLGFKHQFCKFHTKQKINRDINNYLKANKSKDKDIKIIKSFKRSIFDVLDDDSLKWL